LGSVQYDNKLNAYTRPRPLAHMARSYRRPALTATPLSPTLFSPLRAATTCVRPLSSRSACGARIGTRGCLKLQRPIETPRFMIPRQWPRGRPWARTRSIAFMCLGGQLHIEPTNDPAPYATADEMRKDVHEKRHYYLSRAGTSHPVWTSDQVAAFRAVHDILGHGVAGGHYDWPGRNLAAAAHMPLLDPPSQQALFTETVGRQAALQTYGHMPQKITLCSQSSLTIIRRNREGLIAAFIQARLRPPPAVPRPFSISRGRAFILAKSTHPFGISLVIPISKSILTQATNRLHLLSADAR
jgi:hypothetical protein